MPHLSLYSRVAKDTNQVIDRVVDGEALLIHLASGDYYSLNAVGTLIWENVDGSNTIDDLAAVVTANYEVSADQARVDVLELLQGLLDEGLVEQVQ